VGFYNHTITRGEHYNHRPGRRIPAEEGIMEFEKNEFNLGKDYWIQYEKLNGYAFRTTDEGLKKLSKNLDVNITHLRKMINIFLEA
jgi:hypothetical protein